MKEAPLYNDALQLARWIGENVQSDKPMGQRVHFTAVELLEHVTLALQCLDREEEVMMADRAAPDCGPC